MTPLFLLLRQVQNVNMEQTSTDIPAKPQLAEPRSGYRNCQKRLFPVVFVRQGRHAAPGLGQIQGTSPA